MGPVPGPGLLTVLMGGNGAGARSACLRALARRTKTKTATAMAIKRTTPPTAAPTMTPKFGPLFFFSIGPLYLQYDKPLLNIARGRA